MRRNESGFSIIIVLAIAFVVVLGGLAYFALNKMGSLENLPYKPSSFQTSESGGKENLPADVAKLESQSTSDDTEDIKKDLLDTDLTNIDRELTDIDKELTI